MKLSDKAWSITLDIFGNVAVVAIILAMVTVPTAVTVWAVKWILTMLGVIV